MNATRDFPVSVANRPEVSRVVIHPARSERRYRIVHLCNLHLIPRCNFESILKADGLNGDEIERRFEQHEIQIERVQAEQHSLMLFLVKELQLKTVHLEGLCSEDARAFAEQLERLHAQINAESREATSPSQTEAMRQDRLLAGIAGQLSMEGIVCIRPVEDRVTFDAANPLKPNGISKDDSDIEERRETGIVRHLLRDGNSSFVILGGLHDLSNNVPEDCEYVRIETKEYAQLMASVKS